MKQEHEMTPGVLVSYVKAPDVLVPSVATREMKDAAIEELERQGFDCQDFVVQPVYQAMIAAASAPAPAPVERNQCDGCQAGIPVENGMHRMGKPDGYPDLMACTADRYGSAPVEPATDKDSLLVEQLWAVHAQAPDELYPAFNREDAEKHAAALNALSVNCDIKVSAVVVESPWPAAEHWKYLAEQEREHSEQFVDADAIFPKAAPVERVEQEAEELDSRLRAAGMTGVAELLKGAPLDAFIKHAGVNDLGSLLQWAEMRRAECLRATARYDLGEKPEDDDMYEWTVAHCAAFTELHVNLRAAIATPQPAPTAAQAVAGLVEALSELKSLRRAYCDSSTGRRDTSAPSHAETIAISELLIGLDDKYEDDAREAIFAYADQRASVALDRAIDALAAHQQREGE